MIKNVTYKKILKGSIFKVISIVNKITPKKDEYILLHMGNKGVSFNNEALLTYLIDKGYNKSYKIYCSVESKEFFGTDLENVHYITHIPAVMKFLQSKHVFYTAGQLPIKPSHRQVVIHMQHGISVYKTLGALTKIDNGDEFFFTYMIATAPIYVPIEAVEYRCPEECITVCSEPMVDRLIHPKNKYSFEGYKRVLLWAPTFRKSDYLGYNDSNEENLLPLFAETEYEELNQKLMEYECLLMVKIHPSQAIESKNIQDLSNIRIYSHDRFVNEGFNLYDLMTSVDGMLGDYSTASLQFLLVNKPIAYVIPDFEEYKEKRGFVFDNPLTYMPGHIIYSKEDFWSFLKDFSSGNDNYIEERKRVRDIIHYYQDGKSCEKLLHLSQIQLQE